MGVIYLSMNKSLHIFLSALFATLLMLSSISAFAEEENKRYYDNWLDAPDFIFECNRGIRRNFYSDSVLIYCDMMEQYSYDHPDEPKVFKGAVLAAKSRFDYQINNKKVEEEILKYFSLSLETSRKYDYDLTYYQTYHELIQYYRKEGNLLKAKAVIDQMYADAEKTNTPYGLFESSRQLGEFYKQGNQKSLAIENLRKAIYFSYQRHNIANAKIYFELSELYGAESDSSLYYIDNSLERGNGRKDSLEAILHKLYIYGQRGDKESFDQYYLEAVERNNAFNTSVFPTLWKRMEFYRAMLDGKYAVARSIAESDKDIEYRYRMLIRVGEATHDELTVLRNQNKLYAHYDSIDQMMNEINLAEMQVAYNDHRAAEILKLENQVVREESNHRRSLLIGISIFLLLIIALALTYAIFMHRQGNIQRLHNEELLKLNNELRVASEMKTRFIQNMSHEIRTPLNAICGFSQILATPELSEILSDEEKNEYQNHIQVSTDLLTTLINDILVMGDIESGKYKMQLSSYKVSSLIDYAISAARIRVQEGVEMRYDNLLDPDYCLITDHNRFQQVVINFLTNACKHTREGSIIITTELVEVDKKQMLRTSVINTGDPIPVDKAEVIFGRFEKLDNFKQGTGLGLPICRDIARLMNGSVYLDTSFTGYGNRFVFDHCLDLKTV